MENAEWRMQNVEGSPDKKFFSPPGDESRLCLVPYTPYPTPYTPHPTPFNLKKFLAIQ